MGHSSESFQAVRYCGKPDSRHISTAEWVKRLRASEAAMTVLPARNNSLLDNQKSSAQPQWGLWEIESPMLFYVA